MEGAGVVVLDGEGDDAVGFDGGVDAGVVESVHNLVLGLVVEA